MARPATNVSVRITALKAAKRRAAKLADKERLTSKPMADLLRVSWPVLRGWCDEIPELTKRKAFKPGGNGIEWAFDPKKTIDALLEHFEARQSRQAQKSQAISKAVGIDLPGAEEAPSLTETKQLVDLTVTVVGAAEKQRRYMLVDDVIAFVAGYNQRVLDGILGVRTKVDPNGHFTPAVRQAVDEYLRLLATEVHGEAARFIEDSRAGLQQAGVG